MGNRYEASVQGTSVITASTTTTVATLVTPSTTRAVVREIGITLANAPGQSQDILLGYPAAAGATPTNVLGQALDFADTAAATNIVATWTTKPTAPTIPFRRFTLPNVAGAGVVWVYEPNEFIVPISKNLVVCSVNGTNAQTTAPLVNVYFKWSE